MTDPTREPSAEERAATEAICITGGSRKTPCHIDVQKHCLCGDFARAALTAAAQVRERAPHMPLEPTENMLHAARDWSAEKYGKPIGSDAARGCWRAMYQAAPNVPALKKGEE